jgi:DUF177 domain-containing protein
MKSKKQIVGGIQIRISGLSNGVHEYHFSVEPHGLLLEKNFINKVEIDAHLEKTSRQLILRASIHTAALFQCDRCLKEFNKPLSAEYSMVYIYHQDETGAYHPEEVSVISSDTVTIDLTEDVRQLIVLSVPLKLLCSDMCKGLCPRCGCDLNARSCSCTQEEVTDTRWQGLKDLLDK